jgi:hypothetical protein
MPNGSTIPGEITSADDDQIAYKLRDVREAIWNKRDGTVSIESVEDDLARPKIVYQCEEVAPSTLLDLYDKIQ